MSHFAVRYVNVAHNCLNPAEKNVCTYILLLGFYFTIYIYIYTNEIRANIRLAR